MGASDAHPDAVARLLRTRVRTAAIDLPVAGSSMRGTISTGATVSVVAAPAPRRGEIWAFVDDQGTVIVHRVREIDGDTIVGRGTGNPIDDPPVHLDRLIGRVVASTSPSGVTTTFGEIDRLQARVRLDLRRAAYEAGGWRLNRFRR